MKNAGEVRLKVKATQMGFLGTPGRRFRVGDVFFCPESKFSGRWMQLVEGSPAPKDPKAIAKKIKDGVDIDLALGLPVDDERLALAEAAANGNIKPASPVKDNVIDPDAAGPIQPPEGDEGLNVV